MKAIKNILPGLIILLFSFTLSAKEIKIPSITESFIITNPDSSAFTEENLSGGQIISFSLLFGLTKENSPEWNDALLKYNQLKDNLLSMNLTNENEKGEKIMEVMYESTLKNYQLSQTRLDTLFQKGTYNCVSASLLYLALAKELGLDARIQETTRHAFITVYLSDGSKIDVETTNPYGFNPGTKKTLSQNGNGSKKYAIIPKNYYSNRMEISDRKAVTLVAKNLCSEFNNHDQYEQAVPLCAAIFSFVTKEKEITRSDFDLLCGNFAVYADKNDQYETGLDFLEAIWNKYGKTDYLLAQYNDIAFNSAAQSCNENKYDEARTYYNRRKENLTPENSVLIDSMIFQAQEIFICQRMDSTEGIKHIQSVRKNSTDKKFLSQLEKIEEVHWSNLIKIHFDKKEYLRSTALCDEGLLSLPGSIYLKNTKKQSLQNHGITIHNQIVPLIKEKNFSKAQEIVQEALKENPGNTTLQNDLKNILKNMN